LSITPLHAALVRSTRTALTDLRGVRQSKPVAQKMIKTKFTQNMHAVLRTKVCSVKASVVRVASTLALMNVLHFAYSPNLSWGVLGFSLYLGLTGLHSFFVIKKIQKENRRRAQNQGARAANTVRRSTRKLARYILKGPA